MIKIFSSIIKITEKRDVARRGKDEILNTDLPLIYPILLRNFSSVVIILNLLTKFPN